eukprot:CAMPEP_0117035822 /NCGR_PEP_ID=MMETSP0472-20121206/25419_1 /TAXON_ID=693140 ORGANISM="Tiarina fusus, Strain LIS" /NCGR_SAMPLE_ID=MMETSP0472 /ASSEMBLY_ACC=CAM_ASM_000603 /LENGTH=127 /DNA_ID=CAMNT_0004745409 /DNA_START=250 /DNA_END=633 /DNA_ORIENTATION=+
MIAVVLDIFGFIFGAVALGVFMGVISVGAADGQITIDPAALELSFIVIAIVVFFSVLYTILYLGFNIHTMRLALKIRKAIKKQKATVTPAAPQMKELEDYSALPQKPIPVEFQFVQPQPIYLQPLQV